MSGPWGPPPMMYPPCPPWAGWYGTWASPLMHFHLGWSRPTQGFGHRGYYAGDGRYRHVGHQQDRRASGQKNQTVQNAKPDHLVSQEVATDPGHWHEQEVLKDGSSAGQLGSSQERTGPRRESSANGKAKPDTEKSPEEVVVEQNRISKLKVDQDRRRDQLAMTSKLDSPVSQTGPSGFVRFRIEGYIEDYHVQDGSSTSLVSSRPHVQPEEEDPADEGAEDEGRSDRDGER
jgi:hypothetical protein